MNDEQPEIKFNKTTVIKGSETIDHTLPDSPIYPHVCKTCGEPYCGCLACNERDKPQKIETLCLFCSKKVWNYHQPGRPEWGPVPF